MAFLTAVYYHKRIKKLIFVILDYMEIIELTANTIEQYLDDCIEVQKQLVSDHHHISKDLFVQTARDSHSYFIGVINEGTLCALGVMSKVVHPVNVTGYINNIVVHTEVRGRGLFTLMMNTLEQKAKEWECTDLALTCSRQNVQDLYRKRGYSKKDTNFYIQKI